MLSIPAKSTYWLTALFMLVIIIGVQWGFYEPYLSEFPNFIDTTPVIHIHGALLMTWLWLLVIQPLLIYKKKIKWHRTLGKISWVLGPLIIISLFLVGRGGYWRGMEFLQASGGEFTLADNLSPMVLDIRGFITFAIFWALAMGFRKNSAAHMRYMIGTGILAIGPGIGRGLMSSFDMGLVPALTIADGIDLVLVGLFLGYDLLRGKDYRPYLTVFILLLLGSILWQFSYSEAWQRFAQGYADLLY